MRVFLTGGTGFIGLSVARQLRERGDEVVALVRSNARAVALQGLGCRLAQGDVTDSFAIERAMETTDAVFHLAGRYEIGIPKAECPKMQDVNIGGVRHAIDAAITAEIPRIIYASTVGVFGNTNGERVDEKFSRNPLNGFLSCYDESKYRAHVLAQDRIGKGAPITIVQPCAVYGPGDHSEIGRQILLAAQGQLEALVLTDVGLTFAHVDDIAGGFLKAFDSGKVGESYVLGGDSMRLIDVLTKAAAMGGQALPSRRVSTGFLKLIAPVAPWIAPRMGYPPNLREVIKAADGVSYWVDDAKARTELGYTTRPFDAGLGETLMAAGVAVRDE